MRRFWFFAAALLLLWLDVYIITDRAYPVYQKSKDYGWKTQDFVMNDVVGTKLPIDVATDIPALVILIAVAWFSFGQATNGAFTCWALCQPGDHVNLRMEPRKGNGSRIVGWMECGDSFQTDGTSKGNENWSQNRRINEAGSKR